MKRFPYILIIAVLLAFYGCDSNVLESLADDSSKTADIEEAQIALNDGDYEGVIALVGSYYDSSDPDSTVARLLASAYMGKAGIDLTYLIENADSTDQDKFDAIASALSLEITGESQPASFVKATAEAEAAPTGPRYITSGDIEDLLENLEYSQNILSALVNLSSENDDIVQMGMASAIHFIMTIGHCAGEVEASNVPVNTYAYQEVFPHDIDWSAELDDLAAYINADTEIIASLITDLTNVSSAVTVLVATIGADEDLTDEFNDFLRELLGLNDSASQSAIDAAIQAFNGSTVADYISSHLLEYN